MVRSYFPGATLAKLYLPASFVVTVLSAPVARSFSVTVAPTTEAPVASVTVPKTTPVPAVWACVGTGTDMSRTSNTERTHKPAHDCFILSTSLWDPATSHTPSAGAHSFGLSAPNFWSNEQPSLFPAIPTTPRAGKLCWVVDQNLSQCKHKCFDIANFSSESGFRCMHIRHPQSCSMLLASTGFAP